MYTARGEVMRMEKRKQNKLAYKKRTQWFFIAIASLFILLLLGYGVVLLGGKIIANDEDLILDLKTTIRTEEGDVIGTLYKENREFIDLDSLPEHVKEAFIAIEDRRFYEHQGIDLKSITRAVYRDIIAMSKVEGGSTITQQLAKNLFLSNDKTWSRKIKETMAALYLERELSKDEILELYVNEVYFGQGIYGIQTASKYFFSKPADELTVAEGAMLAGLMKGPNGYSPINHPDRALERRNVVLRSMEDAGFISTEQRVTEEEKTLGLDVEEPKASNPWVDSYIDLVMKEASEKHQLSVEALQTGGYDITVYMDPEIQQIAYSEMRNDAYFPGNTEGVEGAFVMLDANNARIVSVIGGRDYQIGDLNRTVVDRQPGSTFKPIAVYGPALMQEDVYTPFTLIPDKKSEEYNVVNANGEYKDEITIYQAIMESTNTSAVWLLDEIGIDYSKGYLEKLGITFEDDGLSIALGGLTYGVTPLKMAQSYQAFASGGDITSATSISSIENRNEEVIYESKIETENVFTSQVAWNMTEMLSGTVQSGTASSGDFNKALAGKTGSTQHTTVDGATKDAWFVGYTPEYVTAMWMGYDTTDKDHYLTGGSSYPTSLTKKILTEIDRQTEREMSSDFEIPENVEPLPEPIELATISDISANYEFGGFSIIRGNLNWNGSTDERVVYRIYQETDGEDKLIDEVKGVTQYTIDNVWFENNKYYVVPYDPNTRMEGMKSDSVTFSW